MNFIFPVPEASVPAVEICSDRSVAGMTAQMTTEENGKHTGITHTILYSTRVLYVLYSTRVLYVQ